MEFDTWAPLEFYNNNKNPLEPKAPAVENDQNSKVPVLLAVRSASQTAPWCQR